MNTDANRRADDREYGKLINSVETLVSEQKEFKTSLKKIDEKTHEIFLWYKHQKKLHDKLQTIGIKTIAASAHYIGTITIAAYLFLTNKT